MSAGDARVPVADCGKEHFNSHSKSEMKMSDYLDYWKGNMEAGAGDREKKDERLLYLKDWHFVQ